MKDKKVLILGVVITVILLFTVGVTYAFLNYSQTGTSNSQLIVGDIYMHFKETNQLTIENAMPYSISYKHNSNITEEEVNLCVDYLTSYWGPEEDNTDPRETYKSFCQGTGTRWGITFQEALDEDLINGEDLIYFEENNIIKSPFVDLPYFEFTIDGKNTYEKEDIWYEIVLSHGNSHATRKERIKDNLLKFRLVEVIDGEEKILFTNRSYKDLTNKRVWVDTILKNTLNEVVHIYRLYMWIDDSVRIGNTVEADYDIETWNNEVYASIKVNVTGDFNEKTVETEASCFETEIYTYYEHNSNISEEEVNLCVNYLTSNWGLEEDNTNPGETYESFCQGTGTISGITFQTWLDDDRFNVEDLIYFEENNIMIIGQEGIAIKDYDASCGSDVIIPKTINGYPVTMITTQSGTDIPSQIANKISNRLYSNNLNYRNKEYNVTELFQSDIGAFQNKGLTSVIIPDSVIYIGTKAFTENTLRSVVIPNSVKSINAYAFTYNRITSVIIPDNVTYLSCAAFDDFVEITKRDDLVCVNDVR